MSAVRIRHRDVTAALYAARRHRAATHARTPLQILRLVTNQTSNQGEFA
jgi:hypothetical protein